MFLKSIGKVIKVYLGKKKVTITLEDRKRIEISHHTYKSICLNVGDEITEEIMKQIESANMVEKFFIYAVNQISKRPYTRSKLREKFYKKGLSKKESDLIIKKLDESHLINDQELFNDYVSYYHMRNIGYREIVRRLDKLGFTKEMTAKIKYNEKLEKEKALAQLDKIKTKLEGQNDLYCRQKITTYFTQKGFDNEVINFILKTIEKTPHKDVICTLKKDFLRIKKSYSNRYKSNELDKRVVNYLLRKGYRLDDINTVKGDSLYEMD